MKYQIVSQIGKGSYSQVYIVKQLEDGQVYVLKERKFLTDETEREAINEAKLLYSIRNHPGIIYFHDAFTIDESRTTCIVMEQAKCDLKDYLTSLKQKKTNPFHSSLFNSWIAQIAMGIDFIHSKEIAHRDIKPANLFILSENEERRIVLGDFGVSKRNVKQEYGTNTLVGTPFYLAPELFLGMQETGLKADVWSFGCVVFELLTHGNHRVFQANTLFELKQAIREEKISWEKLQEIGNIPLHSQQLLRATLSVNPSERIEIRQVLKMPQIIREIGSFITDFAEGKIHLSKKRGECLFQQLQEAGLGSTVLAGIILGRRQRRKSSIEINT